MREKLYGPAHINCVLDVFKIILLSKRKNEAFFPSKRGSPLFPRTFRVKIIQDWLLEVEVFWGQWTFPASRTQLTAPQVMTSRSVNSWFLGTVPRGAFKSWWLKPLSWWHGHPRENWIGNWLPAGFSETVKQRLTGGGALQRPQHSSRHFQV